MDPLDKNVKDEFKPLFYNLRKLLVLKQKQTEPANLKIIQNISLFCFRMWIKFR